MHAFEVPRAEEANRFLTPLTFYRKLATGYDWCC